MSSPRASSGAAGLLFGSIWPPIGVVAAAALASWAPVVSHPEVGDAKMIGPATFMLMLSAALLATRAATF